MMKYRRVGDTIILQLAIGDEVMACLKQLCLKEGIQAAAVQGIGASNHVSLSFYDPAIKSYVEREFKEDFEITSLMGNLSLLEGAPLPHIHINLSDRDYKLIGGHLNWAVISVTGELTIQVLETAIHREFDATTQLNLWDLKE